MELTWDNLADAPETTQGDTDREVTFAGVGRSLTNWENMEFSIAMLYSFFKGAMGRMEYFQEYGVSGKIFEHRLGAMELVAERYFVAHIDHELESHLKLLVLTARKLAIRRNEIAHGVVSSINVNVGNEPDERGYVDFPTRFFLAPPHHAYLKYGDDGQYYYCSQNLTHFSIVFEAFRRTIVEYRDYLESPHGAKHVLCDSLRRIGWQLGQRP